MKKISTLFAAIAVATLSMAQPPADSTPTYPQGATYTHSSGTKTITDNYESSTQYYNVIQCTGGTLTMNGCTITKTGDGSQGDNSSFYGNNSSIYAGAASSTNYQSTTAASGAKIVIKNVTVNSGAVWNLTANTSIGTLVNNGTINTNGYTLTTTSTSGSGTINTTTGISEIVNSKSSNSQSVYTLDGRRANASTKGIVIQNGKKVIK